MTDPSDRRTRKRLATRQGISNAATRLFFERGFDAVTVDEIAAAADVGRMTVFSHFPRKEDMFFDRDEMVREILLGAVRDRDPGVSVLEALRRLARQVVASGPYLRFSPGVCRFVETTAASETLKARARTIRGEVTGALAALLAEEAGRAEDDREALLAAGLVMATISAAFLAAHADYRRAGKAAAAQAVFVDLIDRGLRGVAAAMKGTPYA